MEDDRIIDLYWARSEDAITETSKKYRTYCYAIAYRILSDPEDAGESVNDTYLDAWNMHTAPPPRHSPDLSGQDHPQDLHRQVAWRGRTADKRGGGELTLALDELADCVPSGRGVEHELDARELEAVIDGFVMSLPVMERRVFICRYWYLDPISAIAEQFGFSRSKVKMMLHRQRQKLRTILEQEAFLP